MQTFLPPGIKPASLSVLSEEQAQRIARLIAGYLRQILPAPELEELKKWINTSENNRLFFEELTCPVIVKKNLVIFDKSDPKAALERIKKKIYFSNEGKDDPSLRNLLHHTIGCYMT